MIGAIHRIKKDAYEHAGKVVRLREDLFVINYYGDYLAEVYHANRKKREWITVDEWDLEPLGFFEHIKYAWKFGFQKRTDGYLEHEI